MALITLLVALTTVLSETPNVRSISFCHAAFRNEREQYESAASRKLLDGGIVVKDRTGLDTLKDERKASLDTRKVWRKPYIVVFWKDILSPGSALGAWYRAFEASAGVEKLQQLCWSFSG